MRFLTILCAAGMFVAAAPASLLKVEGAVASPGSIEVKQKMRLRDAVRVAGGATSEANLKRIVVTSAGGERVYDLTKLGPTPFVEPGDLVFVEPIDRTKQIVVKGAVHSPGAFDFQEGMTAGAAIKLAEPVKDLKTESVTVERNIDGTMISETVDMSDVHAMALRPGDTVVVAYQRSSFSDREIITILAIAILILILVKS